MKKNLINKKVRVISDNECYDSFRNEVLIITHASNEGRGYDNCVYPQMLCDFKTVSGKPVGCALYEYEFEVIK